MTDEAGRTGEHCETTGLGDTTILGMIDAVCQLNNSVKVFFIEPKKLSSGVPESSMWPCTTKCPVQESFKG